MEIPCVVKLYYQNSSQDNAISGRCPKELSCRLSLKMADSMHHILLESKAGAKRYQLKPDLVADIVTRRIDEGYLTVAFKPGHLLNQLVVSQVEDKQALRSYAESLEKICFGGSKGHLPLSPPVTPEREQSGGAYSAKRKLSLHLPPRQSPPAERSGLKPAQFYTPSVLSSASSLPPSPQKTITSTTYRRLLVAPNDVLTTTPPSRPAVAKRPPLAVLSESHQGATAKKQRSLYPSLGEMDEMEGFANLGNTCYMNAVLQSLLGLDPFAEDLYNQALVRKVPSKSLYMILYLLLKSKRAKESFESQCVLLTNIKQIIAQSSAKFSGSRQQDAHELLAQCLDQLKQDTDKIDFPQGGQCEKGQASLSPVVRNFECEIMHTITCKGCGKVTQKPEIIYDFALQLPRSVILKPTEQANLQQLFNLYFACEDVEYNCSVCGNKMATLSHQLSKLPRVLVIYLKRYGFNSHACKRIDSIHIPRFINAGPCCVDNVSIPCEFTGPWPRDDSMEVPEEKENIVRDVKANVGTRNGTPTRTATHTQSSVATTESASLLPGATPSCEGSGIQVSESVATTSRLNSETSTPTPTPASTPTLTPASTPTLTPASTPTSPLPHLTSLLHGSLHPVLQNGGRDGSGVLCAGDVDSILTRVDTLDFPTPSKMDDCSNNLSEATKRILGSGYPLPGGMVGVATDTDRTGSREGGVGGGQKKLPTLRRFPYIKRVKRTSSSGSTRAAIAEVCDIVDEFDKLCEAIDDDGKVKEAPAKPSLNTPPIREEHIRHNGTSLQNGGFHQNGCGLNGTPSRTQINGLSKTGSDIIGHDGSVDHATSSSDHVTDCIGRATNGYGYATNGYNPVTNGHSTSPSLTEPGLESNDDSRIHIMDLEEEENDQLKRALEESTKSQPAELVRLQELGMSEEDQLKLALELSIQDSSSVEDMEPLPAIVAADLPIPVTPDQEAQTFRLMSIVNHIGKGSGGGHYITDVNCVRDGTWKSFNDSMVVEMKEEDVRQRRQCTGYIFFYMYKLTYQSVVKHAKA